MSLPIRPNVLGMTPYVPGKPIEEVQRELGLDRVVKLASNENPLGPSPKALAAVKRAAERMHVYPDGASFDLKEAISSKFDVPAGNIIIGNGSDELIHLLSLILLGPGDEMLMGEPGFARYPAGAHLVEATVTTIPMDKDMRHDLPAFARAATERTKLLFIANPNNPTGTIVRKSEVDRLLVDIPESAVVVLDEAYADFTVGVDDFPNSRPYVLEGRNVVGLRTFSKSHGLAGIRLGYGFAPEPLVDAFHRAREPFNVNSLAQAAGIAALDDDEHLHRTVENNQKGLERLAQAFRDAGCKPFESYANFVFADLGRAARPIYEALLRRGVITRPGDLLGLPTALRVTVGTAEEIEVFVREFQAVMTPAGAR
ncbi:MAG: histidinol-phosphate transaminase [Fimbriimonadaceae bacterium]